MSIPADQAMFGPVSEQGTRLPEVPALRHRVHRRLEDLIVEGSLAPGARLVELDLATNLGVSRGPIREALQSLANDGFVDLRPRQGAFVHQPTMEEVIDFYDVRRPLEAQSARLAARRVTPADAMRLMKSLAEAQKVLADGVDPSLHGPAVHTMICDVARNPTLSSMLNVLRRRSRWYLTPFEQERRVDSWAEHAEIVEAVVAQDEERAAAAMSKHIDEGLARYRERRDSKQ